MTLFDETAEESGLKLATVLEAELKPDEIGLLPEELAMEDSKLDIPEDKYKIDDVLEALVDGTAEDPVLKLPAMLELKI